MEVMTMWAKSLGIVGIGMIGGSVALAARHAGVQHIVAFDQSAIAIDYVIKSKMVDMASTDDASVLSSCDLVILAVPVRSYSAVLKIIAPYLRRDVIISDVGSTKRGVIQAVKIAVPEHIFVGAHPIAGLERHGPEHAAADLFTGRWCVITPDNAPPDAMQKLHDFWRAIGSNVVMMDAAHHDRVLAITSHLPQLIARTIVGTAADLEDELQDEVIKFSAGGFRDFTRMAAADPVMWRDIFLDNSDAVLEMLQRLSEDIAMMQKLIRSGDGAKLEKLFERARDIRARVIAAQQA
jgi:cyclohexadieny/prephenate dehydrogenase